MSIFKLVEFEQDRSITIVSRGRLFGTVACTYRVDLAAEDSSRLVAKATGAAPRQLHGPLVRLLLPPGDLMMMRRQLLNLAELAAGAGESCGLRPPRAAASRIQGRNRG